MRFSFSPLPHQVPCSSPTLNHTSPTPTSTGFSLVAPAFSPSTALPADLLSRAAELQRSGLQARLPYSLTTSSSDPNLSAFAGLATVVNDRLTTSIGVTEHNRLHELLFAPTQPAWDPYVHDLDFPRTATTEVLDDLLLLSATTTPGSSAFAIVGGSASGKTVILKRLAFDLARRDILALWLSPWFYQDTSNALTKLFQQLTALSRVAPTRRPIVFMDDPLSFGVTTPADVLAAATNADLPIVLVIAVRTIEWGLRKDLLGSILTPNHLILNDALDDTEEAALSDYLLKLRIHTDPDAATKAVRNSLSRHTRDTLSSLYWLIPETRGAISASVRDEYFRLGDSAALTRVVIGKYTESGQILQGAYAFVATAARYGTPLPIEVLVSALNIPYGDWLEAATPDAPAWGLLYPDSPPDADTVYYRPRSAVVTDIVLQILNGGRLSHGGEVRLLRNLLSACTGTQPQYREFCTRTLVPYSKLTHLTYEEGIQLYDDAIDALPLDDRTLLHHKGLWIKNRGKRPTLARTVLTNALHAPNHPYATKTEPEEHIYTSLAANELDAMDAGAVSLDEGQAAVRQYLDRARSAGFFNLRAVHVGARLTTQLLSRTRSSLMIGDRFRIANEALRDVDQALLSLHVQTGEFVSHATSEDIEMFDSKRHELLVETSLRGEVEAQATSLWEDHRNQEGLILAARARYGAAVSADRGTIFRDAYDYCKAAMATVRQIGADPAPGLFEIALLVYYHWQVARQRRRNFLKRSVDWSAVADYSEAVLRSPTFGHGSHLYRYLRALAAAHLDDWTAASAIWAELRKSGMPRERLFQRRDPLLTDDGVPRVIQGVVTEAGPKRFLMVADLGRDFVLAREQSWPAPGGVAHANILFSFAGPTAVAV